MKTKMELERSIYRKIKRMDKKHIEELLEKVYLEGQRAVAVVTSEQIRNSVKQIPRIGEKRLQQIMAAIEPLFAENDNTERMV